METFKQLQNVLPKCLASDIILYALPPNFSNYSMCKTDFVEIYEDYVYGPERVNVILYKAQLNGDAKFLDTYFNIYTPDDLCYRILGSVNQSYNERIKLLEMYKKKTHNVIYSFSIHNKPEFIIRLLTKSPNLIPYVIKNIRIRRSGWCRIINFLVKHDYQSEFDVFYNTSMREDINEYGKGMFAHELSAICYIDKTNDLRQIEIDKKYQSYWYLINALYDDNLSLFPDELDVVDFLSLYFHLKYAKYSDYDDRKSLALIITKYIHNGNFESICNLIKSKARYIHWDTIIELYRTDILTDKWKCAWCEACFMIDEKSDIKQLQNDITKYSITYRSDIYVQYTFSMNVFNTMNIKQLYKSKLAHTKFSKIKKLYAELIKV